MREKCDAYRTKEILGCGRKLYAPAKRRAIEKVENQRGTTVEARTPIKNQSSSGRMGEGHMRENEKKEGK